MIVGIGTDLIEIERIKKACEKEAFLVRVYTEEERRQAGGNASHARTASAGIFFSVSQRMRENAAVSCFFMPVPP